MSDGCVGGNTPKGVAEKAMKCLKANDYKGYVDLIYLNGEEELDAGEVKRKKEQIAAILEEKASVQLDEKEGIASYEIGKESVEDDEAKVKVRVTYGDGSDNDSDMELVKDKNGNWRLDVGK